MIRRWDYAFDKQCGRARHSVRAVLLQPSGAHGVTRPTHAIVCEGYNPMQRRKEIDSMFQNKFILRLCAFALN
jgi:hypothetical protein